MIHGAGLRDQREGLERREKSGEERRGNRRGGSSRPGKAEKRDVS